MRITTGKYKGRQIKLPKGTRATQEKVRKAIFDILGDIKGLSFLELFAGSGAVGFEAISRGVKNLVLVEYNRDCLMAINKNIETLALNSCSVYPKEAAHAIDLLHKNKSRFDIIFMDPPYYKDTASSPIIQKELPGSFRLKEEPGGSLSKKTLQMLAGYDILTPQGLIIIQHFKKDMLPEVAGSLILFRQAYYGDTVLSFYRKS